MESARGVLRDAQRSIDAALDELARVSSAARHGDQLAAVVVDAHAAAFRRLLAVAEDPTVLTADAELAEVLWVHEVAGEGAALDTMATRVDTLRSSIEQSGVPGLVAAADRLVEALIELHGWALGRAVELLHEHGQGASLQSALDDELIAAVLLAHGMHPVPLVERVERVLAACVTTLGEHAGRVDVVAVDEQAGRVRLAVSGGDAKQRWRTRLTVERALRGLVPDAVDVDVEGADAEPARSVASHARQHGVTSPVLIPITAIARRRTARWAEMPGLAGLGDGEVAQVDLDGVALVACRVGNDYFVAADPFGSNSLRLVETSPPTIEAADGTRLAFTDPLPTHVDGGVVEVLL